MRRLVFGLLLTSLMVGCGGAPQVVSDLPVDAPSASRMVLGTWNVYTHEGELDGLAVGLHCLLELVVLELVVALLLTLLAF